MPQSKKTAKPFLKKIIHSDFGMGLVYSKQVSPASRRGVGRGVRPTFQIEIPDALPRQAGELAAALTAQIRAAAVRPSIAERAERVNWEKLDGILARVPNVPPLPGDKL